MAHEMEFAEFWNHYPRRVGKLAAQRAYEKARKHATADAILAGVLAFTRHMPQEMRFVPHAATFLNQGRWMDEYEDARPVSPVKDWYDECRELHGNACGLDRWKHVTRVQRETAV